MSNAIAKNHQDSGGYVPLNIAMLKSPAWRSLGGHSCRIYLALAAQRLKVDNGLLTMTLKQARTEAGVRSPATLVACLRELQAAGFLAVTNAGRLGSATRFRLTEYETQTQPATNEWKSFAQPEGATA